MIIFDMRKSILYKIKIISYKQKILSRSNFIMPDRRHKILILLKEQGYVWSTRNVVYIYLAYF